VDHIQLKRIQA